MLKPPARVRIRAEFKFKQKFNLGPDCANTTSDGIPDTHIRVPYIYQTTDDSVFAFSVAHATNSLADASGIYIVPLL